MYIKFENREQGRHFTFFSRKQKVNNESVTHTEKSVFGTLSDGIKTGENNGQPIYVNDYWQTAFCGKAYQKALELKDKDRISVIEMNIRNVYSSMTKKSYPQIMVTDFDIISTNNDNGDEYLKLPENVEPLDFE